MSDVRCYYILFHCRVMNDPHNEEAQACIEADDEGAESTKATRVTEGAANGGSPPEVAGISTSQTREASKDQVVRTPALPEKARPRDGAEADAARSAAVNRRADHGTQRAAVRAPERDEPPAGACDIVIRASERIPSPVRGPSMAAPVREVVRRETAARTEALDGTILDARNMRLPRAGGC
jgi:hypothetical protein